MFFSRILSENFQTSQLRVKIMLSYFITAVLSVLKLLFVASFVMLQNSPQYWFGFIHIEQFLIFSAEIHNRSMIAQISTADIKYIVALVKLNHRNMLSI